MLISDTFLDLPDQSDATNRQISARSIDWWHQTGLGSTGTYLIRSEIGRWGPGPPSATGELPNKDRPNQVCSWTSQTSLMPPIDRSRRDLSIGGIRLVWEVDLHTWKSYLLSEAVSELLSTIFEFLGSWKMVGLPDLSSDQNRLYQVCSGTSQTSLMPPIDRSRRDLSIGGIRLVWEVQELL